MSWTERYFQMKVINEWAALFLLVVILGSWLACFVMDSWETKKAKKRRKKK